MALDIYCNHDSMDDLFIEHVREKCVNSGLSEKFWLNIDFDRENNIKGKKEEEKFKENVRNYFFDEPDYAEFYIKYYFMTFEEAENVKFSHDLLKYLYKKELNNWTKFSILDLEKLVHLE